jgi:predicted dehydrogenase
MTALRVGLVGYGLAGRSFHAPLLVEAGLDVAAVVTRDVERAAQVRAELPGAAVLPDLDALLDVGGLDLVVLASPTGLHAEQALACIDAGLPLVVDKPLAIDTGQAVTVATAAGDQGVPLTVFQNRRYDPEHLTAVRLLAEGALGDLWRFERRWERWRPEPKHRWREDAPAEQGGGLLLDLGSHLVDSAVQLLGPVVSVTAQLAAHTTVAEDDIFLLCVHASGATSHLGAHSVAGAPGPRTRLLGSKGAYVVVSFEAEPTAFVDLVDLDDDHCGWLIAGEQRIAVRREPGGAADFYRAVAQALSAPDPQLAMPVDPWDAVHTARVLDAARVSDAQQRTVEITADGV